MREFDHPLWRDALASIQADVEHMTADDLRDRATEIRRQGEQEQISRHDQLTFTLVVFAAILRSRQSHERMNEMQAAWLEGTGISHEDLAAFVVAGDANDRDS